MPAGDAGAGVSPAFFTWDRGRLARILHLGSRASRPHSSPGIAGVSPAFFTWDRGRLARIFNFA